MKKFEKKTVFGGRALSGVDTIAWPPVVREMARHLLDCHVEIDLLESELAPYRVRPAKREWISSETHTYFPERGFYFFTNRQTGIPGVLPKITSDCLSHGHDYTLILAESDFPVPPKPQPLEVKVGKYEYLDNGRVVILEVLAVRTFANGLRTVIYCYPDDVRSMRDVFDDGVEHFQKRLTDTNARFIGGGDDEQ